MKSINVYADHGTAFESRLQAGLDLARSQSGHISFIQVTPYSAFMLMDPMGGSYVPNSTLEQLRVDEAKLRDLIETKMTGEDVTWDFIQYDGDVVQSMVSAARLADVMVLSLDNVEHGVRAHPLLGIDDLVVNSRCPVLAVPFAHKWLNTAGTILVAWDGGHEAANALRAALPMLKRADQVHLLTIAEKPESFPSTAASAYLSRHGVSSELIARERGDVPIEQVIDHVAGEISADLIVMGAYGHSRLRELLLGGVTKYFLSDSNIPLLLAH
ncbi:universal stress protein [Blastomonas sp.]|uniref:universal stress protein n=1 Tax=Blastomonas sp. TaxID=1909299 RepID=UPI00359338FB